MDTCIDFPDMPEKFSQEKEIFSLIKDKSVKIVFLYDAAEKLTKGDPYDLPQKIEFIEHGYSELIPSKEAKNSVMAILNKLTDEKLRFNELVSNWQAMLN